MESISSCLVRRVREIDSLLLTPTKLPSDMYPMLRDGTTGDWYVLSCLQKQLSDIDRVGTFLGHKGAVWDVGLAKDTQLAATASADFTAYVSFCRRDRNFPLICCLLQ
jgi:hypothetical protein